MKKPRRILVTGTFDLLHVGHVRFLSKAKKLGGELIVFLNSDSYVRSKKGKHRPIVGQDQRAELLLALKSVDKVVTVDSLEELITKSQRLKVDICAVASGEPKKVQEGDSWRSKLLTAMPNIKVVTIDSGISRSTSTSAIERRIHLLD